MGEGQDNKNERKKADGDSAVEYTDAPENHVHRGRGKPKRGCRL